MFFCSVIEDLRGFVCSRERQFTGTIVVISFFVVKGRMFQQRLHASVLYFNFKSVS